MRCGNIDEFFEHENQACPPSLSRMFLHREFSPSTRVQVGGAAILPRAAREFSLTMPTKFSYHTYYHSYSMSTDWMSCGMIIIRLKPAVREEREFVDVLSPVMPFPETGRSFSA